jgi:hypothetical protein
VSGFLLDTCVLSELRKPQPNAGLLDWVAAVDEGDLYLSVLTLAEIRSGIESKVRGRERAALETWLVSDLSSRFAGRILDFTSDVADRWGRLDGRERARGKTLPVVDAQIAATALQANLTVVTRNVRDFVRTGVPVLDPWR